MLISFLQWADFMTLGKDVSMETVEQRMNDQYVNKCCSLIYTVSVSLTSAFSLAYVSILFCSYAYV